jgi:predicted  nucleic acid-binding Zn-ribbon protein
MVLHQGRTIDIVDLVQQLVTEQLAPLRTEFQEQADKQASLQHTLLTQRIHDQEQLFLRVKAEFKKGQRDLQQLRRERAKYPDQSQEAKDLDGYIVQDLKDLDIQHGNLQHIYAETLQEAHTHQVPLMTLTGDEGKDF